MNVYVLFQDNHFYSTFIHQKTVMIASTDEHRIRSVRSVVQNHYNETGKWLNMSHGYSKLDPNTPLEIRLGESTQTYSKLIGDAWQVVELDLYNPEDCRLVDFMYECSNIRLFLVKDFEKMDGNPPLLSINGVVLNKPSDTSKYNVVDYLDALNE